MLNWIEQFCKIRAKSGKLVSFKLNAIQTILANYVAYCWHMKFPCRVATPKSRQQGSSTFWELLEYALCELIPGYRAAIVAHDEAGAKTLFDKVETVKRNLKKTEWKPSDLVNDQGVMLKWRSESTLAAATVKTGDGLGKGGSLSAVHFSEVANFCDKNYDPSKAVSSIVNSMAETYYLLEIYESTANGKDAYFFPLCEKARDPSKGSTIRLIFLPWFLEAGYSMKWEDYRNYLVYNGKNDPGSRFEPSEEEKQLREKLASQEVLEHEGYIRYRYNLTDEQLIWRRHAIDNRCEGSLDLFKRYYPSFYEECWTASSTSMFDQATIDHYRASGRGRLARGSVVRYKLGEPVKFLPDPAGVVELWAFPQKGFEYVLAADVGGTTPRSDPSCAYLINKATLEQVALVHGRLEWDKFADVLLLLATFFNQAELVVENNYNPAVANYLHMAQYPRLYYYFAEATIEAVHGKSPGFNTNKKTRPEILSKLRTVTRDRSAVINDPDFWKEMDTFVWHARAAAKNPEMEGDYRASGTNHDDRIMAAAIGYSRCPLSAVEPILEVSGPPPVTSRAYQFWLTLQAEQQKSAVGGWHL